MAAAAGAGRAGGREGCAAEEGHFLFEVASALGVCVRCACGRALRGAVASEQKNTPRKRKREKGNKEAKSKK